MLAQGCELSSSGFFDSSGGRFAAQDAVRSWLSSSSCEAFSGFARFLTTAFRFNVISDRGEVSRFFGKTRLRGAGKGPPSLEESEMCLTAT